MNDVNLETKLNEALEGFKSEVNSQLDHMKLRHDQTVTRNDLEQLIRQMYYCLSGFKDAIVGYVQDQANKG